MRSEPDRATCRVFIGLESTLSGFTHAKLIQRAKSLGDQIELHYLRIPIRRIRQRVKMGGRAFSDADVRRRVHRSRINLIQIHAPLAETWQVWGNREKSPALILSSHDKRPTNSAEYFHLAHSTGFGGHAPPPFRAAKTTAAAGAEVVVKHEAGLLAPGVVRQAVRRAVPVDRPVLSAGRRRDR